MRHPSLFTCAALALLSIPALAHPGHDDNAIIVAAIRAHGSVDAATLPKPEVKIEVQGEYRLITANGLPNHETGQFPGRGNPNAISAQKYAYRVALHPKPLDQPVPLKMQPFGIALNGVVFDPGTNEWWKDDRTTGWHIEALVQGKKPGLGVDKQLAHVQPNGAYHYHGLPPALEGAAKPAQMVLVGWAADGYPIYGPYAYTDAKDPKSPLKKMTPSYAFKKGNRPANSPPGKYDGTYTQDFEFVKGAGDLDECNGRVGVTPEFPEGTYYYLATDAFPFLPRAYHATPDPSFARHGGPGGRRGRPGGQGGPPRGRPGDGSPDGPPPGGPEGGPPPQ